GVFYVTFYYPDFTRCYYPTGCPNPKYELGAFANDAETEVASTYNFIIVDVGATGPQGDVVLDAADPFGTTPINIEAYTDVHKQSGDIHIHTNGFIIVTEKSRDGTGSANRGDLRVAQIQSTNDDVTLYSPGAILDADLDVTETASDAIDTKADVVGRNITMTAGDNTGAPNLHGDPGATSGHGGVGVPGNFLEIHVDADGGALGVLNVTDTASERNGVWSIDAPLQSDPGAPTGTFGVFITQTTGDMQVDRILTNGDASLVAVNGSLRDARFNGLGDVAQFSPANVEANNIDLAAYCSVPSSVPECGDVGARGPPDSFGNDFKIDSGAGDTQHPSTVIVGRVGIVAGSNIFVTETKGALNVLIAQALDTANLANTGNVRLTVREHSTQGDDLNLILPYASDTVAPTHNGDAILIDYAGALNIKRDIVVSNPLTDGTIDSPSINAEHGWILLRVGDNVTLGGLQMSPDFTGTVSPDLTGTVSFTRNTVTGDTISSNSTYWPGVGFSVGQEITVTGAGVNNGTYHIAEVVSTTTLRLYEKGALTTAASVGGVTVSAQVYPDANLSSSSSKRTDAERIAQNTKVVAGLWIDIHGDYDAFSSGGQLDNGFGSVMHLHGTITPGPLTASAPDCIDEINPERDCNVTRIFGNVDTDTIVFDQTQLGGRTLVYGAVAPTCTLHSALAAPTGCLNVWTAPNSDSEDNLIVNQLQTMNVAAGHTLALDGQSNTDTYVINTTGSQPCFQGAVQVGGAGATCHNYVINVLDTGAPDNGSDVLIVNGYDNPQTGFDSLGNLAPGSGYDSNGNPYSTDDIFLLRASKFIGSTPTSTQTNEIADTPAFVALLHGNFGTATPAANLTNVSLTLCYSAGCEAGRRLTASSGTPFNSSDFVVGRRIHLGNFDSTGNAGVWAGDYTIASVGGGGAYIVLAETLPTGVSLTTEQVPTSDVALHNVSIGLLLGDVTTPDPTGSAALRNQNYERINYDTAINGRLIVNGLGGNDYFATDDNSAITTLDGGMGNDTFQIGQIYGFARDSFNAPPDCTPRIAPNDVTALTYDTSCGSLNPQDVFGTVATTRGWLSAGASQPLVAVGDKGDDVFTVYSNQAALRLEGGDDNDLFVVRGFALAQTKTNGGNPVTGKDCDPDPTTPDCEIVWINAQDQIAMPKLTTGFSTAAESDIRTGSGTNQVEYNMNAPVSVDGGAGFDKLVILGTEYADHIVVTSKAIYGVGVSVTYVNIEVLEIDALEGDDTIDVLSTAPGVATRVIGGLGNDAINVAGDVTGDVFSLDIDGTSGTINHGVSSADPNYNGIVADGLDLSVARANQGGVIIKESDGNSTIYEGGCFALNFNNPCPFGPPGTPPVPALDSYTVELASAPTCVSGSNCKVYVTVSAAYPPNS
ncbi:MAG: hypothetical protein WAU41_04785, partial [Gaiellaceae bacterium]